MGKHALTSALLLSFGLALGAAGAGSASPCTPLAEQLATAAAPHYDAASPTYNRVVFATVPEWAELPVAGPSFRETDAVKTNSAAYADRVRGSWRRILSEHQVADGGSFDGVVHAFTMQSRSDFVGTMQFLGANPFVSASWLYAERVKTFSSPIAFALAAKPENLVANAISDMHSSTNGGRDQTRNRTFTANGVRTPAALKRAALELTSADAYNELFLENTATSPMKPYAVVILVPRDGNAPRYKPEQLALVEQLAREFSLPVIRVTETRNSWEK